MEKSEVLLEKINTIGAFICNVEKKMETSSGNDAEAKTRLDAMENEREAYLEDLYALRLKLEEAKESAVSRQKSKSNRAKGRRGD